MKLSYILAFFHYSYVCTYFRTLIDEKKKPVVLNVYLCASYIRGKVDGKKNFPHIRFNAGKRKIIILKKKKNENEKKRRFRFS